MKVTFEEDTDFETTELGQSNKRIHHEFSIQPIKDGIELTVDDSNYFITSSEEAKKIAAYLMLASEEAFPTTSSCSNQK